MGWLEPISSPPPSAFLPATQSPPRNVSTRPPGRPRDSSTVTSYPAPAALSSYAHASPANPPPTTITRLPPPRPAPAPRGRSPPARHPLIASPAAAAAADRSTSRRLGPSPDGRKRRISRA